MGFYTTLKGSNKTYTCPLEVIKLKYNGENLKFTYNVFNPCQTQLYHPFLSKVQQTMLFNKEIVPATIWGF